MQIDMTLATSYKPVLVCIAKVCVLMMFHYGSASILFVTERYAIMLAVLYIDHWLSYEYIVNTNSFIAVLAISLLVHELRDSGVQERIHGELSHTIVLSLLMICNIFVLMVGENSSILHGKQSVLHLLTGSSSTPTVQPATGASAKRNDRSRLDQATAVPCCPGGDSLVYILLTCSLLVVLSTCAMPVSTHDPVLNNLRVWSFTILCMIWLYTVHYNQLRYSSVAPFTSCVLRFSSILFLTPTLYAIMGVFVMGFCLAATYSLKHASLYEIQSAFQPTPDYVHQLGSSTNCATGVVREASPGCVITNRVPTVLSDKPESRLSASNSGISSSANTSDTATSGVVAIGDYGDTNVDIDGVESGDPNAVLDYNSLFEQVLSQQVV